MASKLTFAVPVEWSNARTYERNMIVFIGKHAYTALQDIPAGVEISNAEYWSETGVPFVDLSDITAHLLQLDSTTAAHTTELADHETRITANGNAIVAAQAAITAAQTAITSAQGVIDNIMITLYTPPTTDGEGE